MHSPEKIPANIFTRIYKKNHIVNFKTEASSQAQPPANALLLKPLLQKTENLLSEKPSLLPISLESYTLAQSEDLFSYPGRSCLAKQKTKRLARSFLIRYETKQTTEWLSTGFDLPQNLGFFKKHKKKYIVINSGPSPSFGNLWFSKLRYSRQALRRKVELHLQNAKWIFFTESGPWSMSFAARSPHIYHFREALFMTESQWLATRTRQSGFPPAVLESISVHKNTDLVKISPGLLLWRPAFLRKDQLWIWLRLRSQKTYLFLGNDWPSRKCLFGKKLPPRLWFLLQDLPLENYLKAKKALGQIFQYFRFRKQNIYFVR